jgi:hypothetical protein
VDYADSSDFGRLDGQDPDWKSIQCGLADREARKELPLAEADVLMRKTLKFPPPSKDQGNRGWLFDAYFNLGSFFVGLNAYFAFTTMATGGIWHAVAICVGAIFLTLCAWGLERHLKYHARIHNRSLPRRAAPIFCYALGYLLPLAIG